ncbi:MAG: hypothetical protein AB7T31_06345 [Gemmatimonadales bacterium]
MPTGGGFSLWKWVRKRPKPDRRAVWQEVARSVGGTFLPGKRSSADKVLVAHGPWTIELETYTVHTGEASVTYTRARALFAGQVDIELRIRKRNVFDTILENVGLGGVDPGHRAFAERFVVKGRPETRLRSLVTPRLIEALLAEPKVSVKVKDASRKDRKIHGPRTREASAQLTGVIREANRLVNLIAVTREILSSLEGAGMAARERVGE